MPSLDNLRKMELRIIKTKHYLARDSSWIIVNKDGSTRKLKISEAPKSRIELGEGGVGASDGKLCRPRIDSEVRKRVKK